MNNETQNYADDVFAIIEALKSLGYKMTKKLPMGSLFEAPMVGKPVPSLVAVYTEGARVGSILWWQSNDETTHRTDFRGVHPRQIRADLLTILES